MPVSLDAFEKVLACDDINIDLAHACLLIAQDAYPELHVERYLGDIERMAMRLRGLMPATSAPEERVAVLNQFLFEDLGFRGNTEEYYDPRNSYLNDVLDRKVGIPISLSVVYMAVGRRVGLPLEGVSFPGHFLVRLRMRAGVLVLDPFTGGAPQSEADLRERLQRVIPAGATDNVPISELPLDQFIEAASNRQILARVLRNLKAIYRETDKPERMLEVLNRMLLVAPESTADLRERGIVYQRLECFRAALKDLSDYVEREPDAPDMDEVRTRLVEVSARCARLN
ncbi:MAG TPA: tetratricopeptide repeat protein [Burkholderiales bacterium]|jgi:regulator of sirC expression with transglutaminase-like and TPR domain|nr:tetratricopeptide repeat protein [Burkholderiales bacterium]